MKLTLVSVILGMLCASTGLSAAEGGPFFLEMKNRVSKWEEANLQKAWANKLSVETYEFFLWDKENGALQWFVVQTASDEGLSQRATVYFGVGNKQTGSRILEASRATHLLNEIGKSELFHLPAVVADSDAPQSIFANTGLAFFFGRRMHKGSSTEVFRWIGESYPVEKIVDALVSVTNAP